MEKITRLAATRIQALYRSYKIRQSFQEHKDLLLKHERLRSSRKTKKISSSIQRNKSKVITQAGSFLGHVIEEKHKTASLKNWPLWSKQKNKLTEITVHTIPNLHILSQNIFYYTENNFLVWLFFIDYGVVFLQKIKIFFKNRLFGQKLDI